MNQNKVIKVSPRSNCTSLAFYHQSVGGPSTERHSCLGNVFNMASPQPWLHRMIILISVQGKLPIVPLSP